MQITVRLEEKELDNSLLETLKKLFKGKEITIVVDDSIDETAYLLSNEANKQRLLQSVININKSENLTELNLADLKHSI